TRAITSNPASIPRVSNLSSRPRAVISTNVPSNGRQRRISMLERDLIECEQAFHTVSDVPATQSRSTDVFDVAIEFERRFAGLADKLGAQFLISNLASVGLAIVHDFNLLNRTISIDSRRVSDEFVFADNFIDDKPTTATYPPD